MGDGPPTYAQLLWLLVRTMHCTPLEAVREYEQNPVVLEVLLAAQHEEAFSAVERWSAMTDEQRRGQTAPAGRMVALVERHRRTLLEERVRGRAEDLAAVGRL